MVKHTSKLNKKVKESLTILAFCLPWLIGFFVLTVYPIIETLYFSFCDVTVTPENGVIAQWVGFNNFREIIINNKDFNDALWKYVLEIALSVPIIIVVSLIIALLLNSVKKGKGVFRTIFFLPVIITSGPVISQFISQGVASFPGVEKLFDLNSMTGMLPEFLLNALTSLIDGFIMTLWFAGMQILIFLTGLQKLDKSMYEAAKIDGASSWECFWKITLPALNPIIVINVVFTVVMQSMSTLNPIIEIIRTAMFETGALAGYGYASAQAWIYFVFLIAVLAVFFLIFRRNPSKIRRM